MKARSNRLAERRRVLREQSDRNRASLGAILGGIERKVALADVVVTSARRLNRHRALVGAAGAFLVLTPLAARAWIRRALWLAPLALEGYRVVRTAEARRGAPPADED